MEKIKTHKSNSDEEIAIRDTNTITNNKGKQRVTLIYREYFLDEIKRLQEWLEECFEVEVSTNIWDPSLSTCEKESINHVATAKGDVIFVVDNLSQSGSMVFTSDGQFPFGIDSLPPHLGTFFILFLHFRSSLRVVSKVSF